MFEWVSKSADEAGVPEETLWNLAEKLLLEPESIEHIEKELRLKLLYEIQLNRLEGVDQDALGSWVQINFTVDSEREQLQFSYGQFSVPVHGEDYDAEAMKRITREEDMEVSLIEEDVIATRPDDRGPVWAVQVTKRILNEVYGASFGDITQVEEEGDHKLTWEEVVEYR
jgi:hypothetical protein